MDIIDFAKLFCSKITMFKCLKKSLDLDRRAPPTFNLLLHKNYLNYKLKGQQLQLQYVLGRRDTLEAIAEGLKTELEPFNIKIATVNPGAFDTGFNDRGMDSIRQWYDPKTNFTSEAIFAGFEEMLSQQFDPQMMVDVIVDVILSDNPNFRNVCPQPV